MRVWITKYALTQGLFEMDAEIVDHLYARGKARGANPLFTREWAKTREEAVKIAEDMRQRRIASLNKNIKRLEGMKF